MAWPARKTPTTPTPSQYTDYGSIDAVNDNIPQAANDNYQTVSQRFTAVRRTQGRTDPTKENQETAERERRVAQKQAELEEFMSTAAYQENIDLQRRVAIEQEIRATRVADQTAAATSTSNSLSAAELARNTSIMWWQVAWHTWFYLSFQLPMAFISLGFFGIQATLDGTRAGRIVQGVAETANNVTSFFGFDFSSLAPMSIGLGLHFLVFGLSLLGLLCTMLVYMVRGQSAFAGDRMIGKTFSLLGCFIGYSTPLLNLFPWIGFYIYVMWRSKS